MNSGDKIPAVTPTKVFTAEEWAEMTAHDDVKNFVEHVNTVAEAKHYWHEDYRVALYDAFQEEYAKRMMLKYNNGEPFSIRT